jgi:hypothetical protein
MKDKTKNEEERMDGLAVLCTSCKKLFFIPAPFKGHNSTVSFGGGIGTPCPKCKKRAILVEGSYSIESDIVKRIDPIDLKDLFKLGINEIIELKRVFE